MLFNKEKLRCLFCPSKNGTHTAFGFLENLGWHSYAVKNQFTLHVYPKFAVEKYLNLNNYELYSFYRDPVDRFVSGILFTKQKRSKFIEKVIKEKNLDFDVESMTYDQFVDHFDSFTKFTPIIFEPQVNWISYPRINVLDFDNYESELRRISDAHDANKYPMLFENKATEFGKERCDSKSN